MKNVLTNNKKVLSRIKNGLEGWYENHMSFNKKNKVCWKICDKKCVETMNFKDIECSNCDIEYEKEFVATMIKN